MEPGIIYSKKREGTQHRYQTAVKRASFLTKKQREMWGLLGYILTTEQLQQAERMIIDEDLRRLLTKKKLEKLKPTKTS